MSHKCNICNSKLTTEEQKLNELIETNICSWCDHKERAHKKTVKKRQLKKNNKQFALPLNPGTT